MTTTDAERTIPVPGQRFAFEPPKIPADRFSEMVRLFTQMPEMPPQLANALRAVAWLIEVDAFREQEERFMVEGKYEETLMDHRAALASLISDGEQLVLSMNKVGFDSTHMKFRFEDVQATLDSLHMAFRCEHGPKNSRKTNELIAQIFDGSKS
jgi:hypothetical protein